MSTLLRRIARQQSLYCACMSARSYSQKASEKYPRRIFSGIQPTGMIHLGNYFGAIRQWVELQDSEETMPIWSIVDLHSITMPHEPEILANTILETTATLLACGIDPQRSILFQQSSVPLHAQLGWVLGCITTMARLGHLPQYKEKSANMKNIPLGLYVYPVLQAADILLYRATHVPVGEDQAQHIQLAQDLAGSFNKTFGETFPVPRSMISGNSSQRIKSLRNPAKKMSKSDADSKGCLNVVADPDELHSKIKKAVTDCTSLVAYDPINRPGVANLISIHSLLTGKTPEEICEEARELDTGKYKLVVADVVIEKLRPIREEYHRLIKEPGYLENVLEAGNERATAMAMNCWLDVKRNLGFVSKTMAMNVRASRTVQS